ncbi:hypothetical protein D3C71_1643340 [compost metagenome]
MLRQATGLQHWHVQWPHIQQWMVAQRQPRLIHEQLQQSMRLHAAMHQQGFLLRRLLHFFLQLLQESQVELLIIQRQHHALGPVNGQVLEYIGALQITLQMPGAAALTSHQLWRIQHQDFAPRRMQGRHQAGTHGL